MQTTIGFQLYTFISHTVSLNILFFKKLNLVAIAFLKCRTSWLLARKKKESSKFTNQ